MKASDTQAASIQWGIELETRIPDTAGVSVGGYHNGLPVRLGMDQANGLPLTAPTFDGGHWRADRDGSISCDYGQTACEFVSPILRGEGGVEHLMRFVQWANAIGATVNSSCGCHITVGIESVIGTSDVKAVSEFIRKLAHICRWHASASTARRERAATRTTTAIPSMMRPRRKCAGSSPARRSASKPRRPSSADAAW